MERAAQNAASMNAPRDGSEVGVEGGELRVGVRYPRQNGRSLAPLLTAVAHNGIPHCTTHCPPHQDFDLNQAAAEEDSGAGRQLQLKNGHSELQRQIQTTIRPGAQLTPSLHRMLDRQCLHGRR